MKKIATALFATIMLLSLCACGSSSMETASESLAAPEASEMYEYESNDTGMGEIDAVVLENQKIIYTGDVSIETKDFEQSIKDLEALVEKYEGYIQYSHTRGNEYDSYYGRYANYTIRIPSDKFTDINSSFSAIGNVTSSSKSQENVTSQYIDVESRLKSYRIQEERLLTMLESAENLDDMLTIEGYLADVRYSIESYTTQKNALDNEINYCTIEVSLDEVVEYDGSAKFGISFGEEMKNALTGSFGGLINVVQGIILFVLSFWYLIVIAVVAVVVVKRKIKRKKTSD